MRALLDRRLLFVTGKGGTGKTTAAAALADLAVRAGRRVLVVEMDAKGAIAAAFEVPTLTFEPTEAAPGLWLMAMNTEDSLREYLRVVARVPLVGRIGPLARTFDFVADAAPGVKEILAIGKVCWEVRERHYDLVIVDAEASGHIVAQIDAPRAIRELVQVGPVREQTEWMLRILDDADTTGVVVVTTPEEMPVTESVELVEQIGARTKVDVAAVLVNRMLSPWFEGGDRDAFEALCVGGVEAVLVDVVGGKVGSKVPAVLDAASLAQHRAGVAAGHVARLREGIAPDVPMLSTPELFTKASGRRVVTLMADHLAAQHAAELHGTELDGAG